MGHIRQLPSKKWQGIVTLPGGNDITFSHVLKPQVRAWIAEQEAALAAGTWRDPKLGKTTVATWHTRWWASLVAEPKTLVLYEGALRLHVLPYWRTWPLEAIKTVDVQTWVKTLADSGVGARMVQVAHGVLRQMLGAAVVDGLITRNPAVGVAVPRRVVKADRFFTRPEVEAIIAAFHGDRDKILLDLACHTGLRWGEAVGLRADHVDFLRRRIAIVWTMTDAGPREYPKSRKSRRVVPLPRHLVEPLSSLVREREDLLFITRTGQPLDRHNWRASLWKPALARAGVDYAPFHTTRHTAASWLVQAGVPLYDVQGLLGHESFATTTRYAHLVPDHFDVITDVWERKGHG